MVAAGKGIDNGSHRVNIRADSLVSFFIQPGHQIQQILRLLGSVFSATLCPCVNHGVEGPSVGFYVRSLFVQDTHSSQHLLGPFGGLLLSALRICIYDGVVTDRRRFAGFITCGVTLFHAFQNFLCPAGGTDTVFVLLIGTVRPSSNQTVVIPTVRFRFLQSRHVDSVQTIKQDFSLLCSAGLSAFRVCRYSSVKTTCVGQDIRITALVFVDHLYQQFFGFFG
mmetsp:Transcript_8897/g.21995  ORF Transcript_8897/g.21995 Transcript_8897/m.21995 type:complete len:223 (-) Transcript_8897:1207-1875(-)